MPSNAAVHRVIIWDGQGDSVFGAGQENVCLGWQSGEREPASNQVISCGLLPSPSLSDFMPPPLERAFCMSTSNLICGAA